MSQFINSSRQCSSLVSGDVGQTQYHLSLFSSFIWKPLLLDRLALSGRSGSEAQRVSLGVGLCSDEKLIELTVPSEPAWGFSVPPQAVLLRQTV